MSFLSGSHPLLVSLLLHATEDFWANPAITVALLHHGPLFSFSKQRTHEVQPAKTRALPFPAVVWPKECPQYTRVSIFLPMKMELMISPVVATYWHFVVRMK